MFPYTLFFNVVDCLVEKETTLFTVIFLNVSFYHTSCSMWGLFKNKRCFLWLLFAVLMYKNQVDTDRLNMGRVGPVI